MEDDNTHKEKMTIKRKIREGASDDESGKPYLGFHEPLQPISTYEDEVGQKIHIYIKTLTTTTKSP